MHLSWHLPLIREKTRSWAGDEEMPKEMWDILSTLLLGQDFVSLYPPAVDIGAVSLFSHDSEAKAGDREWKASRLRKAEAESWSSRPWSWSCARPGDGSV